MVIDRVENLRKYESINPRFAAAFAYFDELVKGNVPDGKYVMPNCDVENEIYVVLMTRTLEEKEALRAESHEKYIDVQVVLEGQETMYVPSYTTPEVEIPYNQTKDITMYAPVDREDCHTLKIDAGSFAMYLDGELHIPDGGMSAESEYVRKAVIKVLA